jgi:protein-tyrosine-phosphatase
MTKSVLFVCNLNSVRSPMAAALLLAAAKGKLTVDSAGVYEGGVDPFVESVLAEVGLPRLVHAPKSIDDITLADFDTVIALTTEAAEELRRLLPREKVEFWSIENPSEARGGRESLMAAYRAVRDDLSARLRKRFPALYESP